MMKNKSQNWVHFRALLRHLLRKKKLKFLVNWKLENRCKVVKFCNILKQTTIIVFFEFDELRLISH